MKKNVLALSMSAAILSFGFAGAAYAITDTPNGGTGDGLSFNEGGIGHMLLVPYFTAQDKNATLLNVVNTDTNGKIVKVRFRSAANSDDLYDFLVFMSPGDVWTASVNQNADGLAALTTTDSSCTKPAKSVINATPFKTIRLDQSLTAAQKANGAREGYVEMFVVADVPKSYTGMPDSIKADGTAGADGINDLYNVTKHSAAGTTLCAGGVWSAIDDNKSSAEYRALGMANPTTGLMGSWTIINLDGAAAWAGNASAIEARSGTVPSKGNLLYWPQVATALTANVTNYTVDPLFYKSVGQDSDGNAFEASVAISPTWVDMPDMSTPYYSTGFVSATATLDGITPGRQAAELTKAISKTRVINEYSALASIGAETDWVFSMPTRRYSVALDYASIGKARTATATDTGKRFSIIGVDDKLAFYDGVAPQLWFRFDNTDVQTLNGYRQICASGIGYTPWNREESFKADQTEIIVSPVEAKPGISFCGEVSLISFNGDANVPTYALKGAVTQKNMDVGFDEGWMVLNITNIGTNTLKQVLGYPVLGGSFTTAAAEGSKFGGNWDHKFVNAPVNK